LKSNFHLNTKKYKDVCLWLDHEKALCTVKDDGQPLIGSIENDEGNIVGERITWTAPQQKKAVQVVELVFGESEAAVADLKIFYRLPGRYRSLKIDQWVDGSCLKTEDIENSSFKVPESSDAVTIWKGKLKCQKLGFAYALFSQKGVFCKNSIRRDLDNSQCTSKCSGMSLAEETGGSENYSNVYLITELKVWHGEEDIANWKIFESFQNEDVPVQMFDNNKLTSYYLENPGIIEVIFKEPIFVYKLVISKGYSTKVKVTRNGFG